MANFIEKEAMNWTLFLTEDESDSMEVSTDLMSEDESDSMDKSNDLMSDDDSHDFTPKLGSGEEQEVCTRGIWA